MKMVDLSIVFVCLPGRVIPVLCIWIQGTGDSSSLKHGKIPHVQRHKHRQPSWNNIYIHLYPSISIYIHLYPSISMIYIHLCPYHPSSAKTSIPPLLLHQGDAPVLRHRQLPRRQVFQQRRFAHAVGAKEAVVWPADTGGGDHGELRHFIWRTWEAEP